MHATKIIIFDTPDLGDPVECPCFTETEVKDEVDSFAQEFRVCVEGTKEITIALPDDNNFTISGKDKEFGTLNCVCNKNQTSDMDTQNQMTLSEDEYDSCTKILEKVIDESIFRCEPAEEQTF